MQLKFCSDQIQRLTEDKIQSSVTLENTHRRLLDVRRSSQQARDTVAEVQSKIGSSRVTCMELHVELDKERYLVCNVNVLFYLYAFGTDRLGSFYLFVFAYVLLSSLY